MTYSNHKDVKLFLILHNIRSAYNVGSIFRTADAVGVEKIFLGGITPIPGFNNYELRITDSKKNPIRNSPSVIGKFPNNKVSKTALGAEKTVPWEYHKQTWRLLQRLREEKCKMWR